MGSGRQDEETREGQSFKKAEKKLSNDIEKSRYQSRLNDM